MKCFFALALVSVSMASAIAQEMSPPKEVTSLRWMVGTWSGHGKVSFGGHETEIFTTMTVSFDGQFLKVISTDKSSGFTMTKTSLTGWEAGKSQYVNYTFTNIAPTARIEHGTMKEHSLVLVSEPWEAEGMKVVGRETMSRISDKRLDLLLEAKVGEGWKKEMEFVLTKK